MYVCRYSIYTRLGCGHDEEEERAHAIDPGCRQVLPSVTKTANKVKK